MTHIYINPNNEYPRHIGDILLAHPDYDGVNLPEGWKPVQPTEPPVPTEINQVAREITPALIDGVWQQQWELHILTEEELAAIAAEETRPHRRPF